MTALERLNMVQGAKKTCLGETEFSYKSGQCAVTCVGRPCGSMITEAAEDKPMLCVALDIDGGLMAELIGEANLPKPERNAGTGIGVVDADDALTDAFYRLLCLKDYPADQKKVLSSFVVREIYYRLLTTPIGNELRLANTTGTRSNQIARATAWLKANFKKAFSVEELADRVNMSSTSFYRNFNKITGVSPIQYQKRLRLHEAQRLMIAESVDAARAAYEVGYESVSQFNREYKRLFGAPPKTDVNRLKNA